MPKKPFTPEEVAAQRQRIMDSASQVMAEVGFHHLSMRKLASQLGMTASNIYNYFPNKEVHSMCIKNFYQLKKNLFCGNFSFIKVSMQTFLQALLI